MPLSRTRFHCMTRCISLPRFFEIRCRSWRIGFTRVTVRVSALDELCEALQKQSERVTNLEQWGDELSEELAASLCWVHRRPGAGYKYRAHCRALLLGRDRWGCASWCSLDRVRDGVLLVMMAASAGFSAKASTVVKGIWPPLRHWPPWR